MGIERDLKRRSLHRELGQLARHPLLELSGRPGPGLAQPPSEALPQLARLTKPLLMPTLMRGQDAPVKRDLVAGALNLTL